MTDPSGARPSDTTPVSGWTAPESRPPGAARVILLILVGIGAFFAIPVVALIFLGSQVSSVLGGTVQFGTSGSGCSANDVTTSLPASGPVYVVGYLERPAEAGETIVVRVSSAADTVEVTRETVSTQTRCLAIEIPAGSAAPDRYTFDFTIGDEELATGTVGLTED